MTSSLRQSLFLAFIFIAVGLGVMAFKVTRYDFPVFPRVEKMLWDFEVYMEFQGQNEPARIDLFLPSLSDARAVSGEQFYNGSFGLTLNAEEETGNRSAVWSYRFPSNKKVLRYAAQVEGERASTPFSASFDAADVVLDADTVPLQEDVVKRQAFIVFLASLRRRSSDDLTFVEFALRSIFNPNESAGEDADEIAALLDGLPSAIARLELARQTLAANKIRARIANGVYLATGKRRAEIEHWLEYRIGDEERRYFPSGEPARFLTIWHGDAPLLRSRGIGELDLQIGFQSRSGAAEVLADASARKASPVLSLFSFGALPVTTQLVYKVLVTIPVGITLLVFLRQFIGIETLGTFMPVLIGIAFRETALLSGVVLFTSLVVIGLALRFYLERLQLLLVPRLAVVLIFIVIAMAAITNILSESNQSIGLSISLFPMVILTMTIERMSILWEEVSGSEAVKQGLGSLVVAALAYLVMANQHVEFLMYYYPELLFVLMGICLLMGRYTGLRASEVWRFRELARSS
ncbi:MAG: UUP1 family membrane protein [Pseudomonadota bacterium]